MIYNKTIYESDREKLYFEYLYTVQGHATYNISVTSGSFSGEENFCMSYENIERTIDQLKQMHIKLSGTCTIRDEESDSYFTVTFVENKLKVYGQLGGSYNEHFMKFSFYADQTILMLLTRILKQG